MMITTGIEILLKIYSLLYKEIYNLYLRSKCDYVLIYDIIISASTLAYKSLSV